MKDFEVSWKSHGTVIVSAETKEEAMELVQSEPYEYIDFDNVVDNLVSVSAQEYIE